MASDNDQSPSNNFQPLDNAICLISLRNPRGPPRRALIGLDPVCQPDMKLPNAGNIQEIRTCTTPPYTPQSVQSTCDLSPRDVVGYGFNGIHFSICPCCDQKLANCAGCRASHCGGQ